MSVMRLACGLLCACAIGFPAMAQTIRIDQNELRRQAYIEEPTLRIELIESAPDIRLRSAGSVRIEFGDGTNAVLPANAEVRWILRGSRAPVRQYSVGVRTFLRPKVIEAQRVAAEWQAKGYAVRLVEAGHLFRSRSGSMLADTRVYWVVLEKFPDEKQAEDLERNLQQQGAGTWILMETVRRASGTVEVRTDDGGVLASGPTPVTLNGPEPIGVANVQYGVGFWGRGHREQRLFPGALEVDATVDGMLTLFETVDIEDYIAGVVPVEISVKAPLEAMRAQAVAARTEALAKWRIKHFGEPFDFCASQHCQAYGGLTRINARTTAAVEGTRGIALMHDGGFVDAVYSANCGGHTEDNDKVWSSNPNPVLRGKLDAPRGAVPFRSPLSGRVLRRWLTTRPQTYCGDPRVNAADKFRWRVRYTPAQIRRHVNAHYRVGTIRDITLHERGVSGRLRRVRIVGTTDKVTVRKELNIRRVLGGLKSAMFVLDISRGANGAPTAFTFTGGGWGHGVGMCQNGATGMALEGYKFPAILGHYFSQTYLQRVYG